MSKTFAFLLIMMTTHYAANMRIVNSEDHLETSVSTGNASDTSIGVSTAEDRVGNVDIEHLFQSFVDMAKSMKDRTTMIRGLSSIFINDKTKLLEPVDNYEECLTLGMQVSIAAMIIYDYIRHNNWKEIPELLKEAITKSILGYHCFSKDENLSQLIDELMERYNIPLESKPCILNHVKTAMKNLGDGVGNLTEFEVRKAFDKFKNIGENLTELIKC